MGTEKEIQKAIIDLLRLKKYVVFKHHSTGFTIQNGETRTFRYGDKGISDIIACSPSGRFVAIEVKKKGGKVSDEQLAFLASVRQRGGLALLAYSVDDVLAACEGAVDARVHEVFGEAPVSYPKPTKKDFEVS